MREASEGIQEELECMVLRFLREKRERLQPEVRALADR
jgi:hypothetical protein